MNAPPTSNARPWLAVLLAGVIAGAGASVGSPGPPAAVDPTGASPPRLERWLFNSAERTDRAIERFDQEDAGGAVEDLEIAWRLAGDDPRARINAGVGRLAAGCGDARSLLEAAAEAAGGELAPWARYNLGNARMADDDLPGAIEAYQQTLREAPGHQDAKYNLELARHRLEEQERQESEPEPPPAPPPPSPPPPQPQGSGPQPQPPPEGDAEQDAESQGGPRQSPLPQFRDLPDMSAEEAAAILEAVENLEREGRQRRAMESARRQRPGEKDW